MYVTGNADGPTVVFSNALGASSDMWSGQIAAIEGDFRVVAYDHPPLNTVTALSGDLLHRLDAAGIATFSLCGLSLGAMVGMQIAASNSERVDRLVLCCTAARFGAPEDWRAKAQLVRRQGMQDVAEEALDKWFTPAFRDRRPFLEMQLAVAPDDYARGLEAIGSFDFRDRLGEIRASTLVVAGAEDEATPPRDAGFIAERINGSKLLVLEEAAHLAPVEQPEVFNAALREHLHA